MRRLYLHLHVICPIIKGPYLKTKVSSGRTDSLQFSIMKTSALFSAYVSMMLLLGSTLADPVEEGKDIVWLGINLSPGLFVQQSTEGANLTVE